MNKKKKKKKKKLYIYIYMYAVCCSFHLENFQVDLSSEFYLSLLVSLGVLYFFFFLLFIY
jgi:hypothetical protein